MPLVKNVGDIILLRNCQCCMYKGKEQFNVNLQWHSEFMLFDAKELTNDEIRENPERQFLPYQMRLQSSEFVLSYEEKNLIMTLREWSNKVFSPTFVYPNTMYDSCAIVAKQARECDLHCKIIDIRSENDIFYEICINDQTGCKLFLKASENNMKQWDVKVGDIVRIRSIIAVKGTSNYIELRPTSHFIKFPKHSRVYQEIEARLKDDQTITTMMSSSNDEVILEHPITVSRTSERYNSVEFRTLYELFHDPESPFNVLKYSNYYDELDNPLQSRLFRLKFYVIRIDPAETEEFVQIFCEKCNISSSLKNYGEGSSYAYKCLQCKEEHCTSLAYQVQFLIKDDSVEEIDYLHRMLLYTHNRSTQNVQGFFGGIKPTNLYSNYKELENIRKYVNLITKFNIYIEAVVEINFQNKQNPYLLMFDSVLHSSYLNN